MIVTCPRMSTSCKRHLTRMLKPFSCWKDAQENGIATGCPDRESEPADQVWVEVMQLQEAKGPKEEANRWM